jgi:hypothetical protein
VRDYREFERNEILNLDTEPVHDLAGHRITENETEALADAIEADEVEVDESNVVYPSGRPSLRDP